MLYYPTTHLRRHVAVVEVAVHTRDLLLKLMQLLTIWQ